MNRPIHSADDDDLSGLNELPSAVREQIAQLQADCYFPYRLWANGVELRKGASPGPIRILFSVLILCCMPLMPFVARSATSTFFGYRHRILLSLDEHEPLIRFV